MEENTNTNPKNKNKSIIILILVILALIAVFVVYKSVTNTKKAKQQPEQTPQATRLPVTSLTVKQIENSTLPVAFPKDIPLEKGAEILENYNAEKNGRIQATYSFLSKKTINENYQLYYNYLTERKNLWYQVNTNTSPDGQTQFLFAKRGGIEEISISVNPEKQGARVVISVTSIGTQPQK